MFFLLHACGPRLPLATATGRYHFRSVARLSLSATAGDKKRGMRKRELAGARERKRECGVLRAWLQPPLSPTTLPPSATAGRRPPKRRGRGREREGALVCERVKREGLVRNEIFYPFYTLIFCDNFSNDATSPLFLPMHSKILPLHIPLKC